MNLFCYCTLLLRIKIELENGNRSVCSTKHIKVSIRLGINVSTVVLSVGKFPLENSQKRASDPILYVVPNTTEYLREKS